MQIEYELQSGKVLKKQKNKKKLNGVPNLPVLNVILLH